MGNRANLVVVDGDEPDIRYGHWAANDLSNHLVLGPAWTESFIRHHESGTWLDNTWAEGGVAMDPRRRTLIWFDNLSAGDPTWQRLVAHLLSQTWPGWSISYAHHGICEIAAAAGVDLGVRRPTFYAVPDDGFVRPLRYVAGYFAALFMHSHQAFHVLEWQQIHSALDGPPLDDIFLNRPYGQPTPSFVDLRRVAEHLAIALDEAA